MDSTGDDGERIGKEKRRGWGRDIWEEGRGEQRRGSRKERDRKMERVEEREGGREGGRKDSQGPCAQGLFTRPWYYWQVAEL